jgi:sugar phosphate permease
MAIGLILSAVMNLFFGLSSALGLFILFWALNNLFQGMGMPPCSRLLSAWFSPKESGRAWGIWNASHQLGGATIVIFSGFLVANYGWRAAFIVPSIVAVAVGFFIINRLRDTPESLGLPPVEEYTGEKKPSAPGASAPVKESQKEIFVKYILKNKMIWIVAAANFFVYIVRIGIIDWAPKMLVDSKGMTLKQAGIAVSTFEIAGMTGAFISGLVSDKIFSGRRGPVTVIFMLLLIASIIGFIYVPAGGIVLISVNLMLIGFFVYGPQMLVAVAAADFATRKAAATAVGLTGLFGYIGATFCGIGTGIIVDRYGWNGGIIFYVVSAFIGTLLFMTIWNKKPPVPGE